MCWPVFPAAQWWLVAQPTCSSHADCRSRSSSCSQVGASVLACVLTLPMCGLSAQAFQTGICSHWRCRYGLSSAQKISAGPTRQASHRVGKLSGCLGTRAPPSFSLVPVSMRNRLHLPLPGRAMRGKSIHGYRATSILVARKSSRFACAPWQWLEHSTSCALDSLPFPPESKMG